MKLALVFIYITYDFSSNHNQSLTSVDMSLEKNETDVQELCIDDLKYFKTTNTSPSLTERFSASKKLSNLLFTPSEDDDPAAKKRKLSLPIVSSYGKNAQTSCYFNQVKKIEDAESTKNVLVKARVSGLLKNKKCHQKNLLQMWSKNT